jgi:hypothetical protein
VSRVIFQTENLIESIKRRSMVPTSQQTFQDSDFIDLLNEELQVALVPDIMSAREGYFLKSARTPLVANQSDYGIPKRAIGNALRDVYYVDESGSRFPLRELKISDLDSETVDDGTPNAFYIQGEKVVLSPTPAQATGSLELWHYRRPSDVVATTSCAQITAINSVGGATTFTVDTNLSASLPVGSLVDIISTSSPNLSHADDAAITIITASEITVATSAVVDANGSMLPQVGDYICPAGKANIPQIPVELHPILTQQVAARLVEALGDMNKFQIVNAKLQEMRAKCFNLISDRVEDRSPRIFGRKGVLDYSAGN